MNQERVPGSTVGRLPSYLRGLIEAQARRMTVVSSGEIAEMSGTNAAQVRKDLSYLGELGTRGIGYDVDDLIGDIAEHLGLDQLRRIAIVGYGRLGGALRHYGGFMDRGFTIAAVLDNDPEKIGRETGGLVVESVDGLERVVKERDVDIAVVATPAQVAQGIGERLAAAGVTSILNFAPVHLELPEGVAISQVDLASELQILSFHLAREDG